VISGRLSVSLTITISIEYKRLTFYTIRVR